jgi:hypothetical protein
VTLCACPVGPLFQDSPRVAWSGDNRFLFASEFVPMPSRHPARCTSFHWLFHNGNSMASAEALPTPGLVGDVAQLAGAPPDSGNERRTGTDRFALRIRANGGTAQSLQDSSRDAVATVSRLRSLIVSAAVTGTTSWRHTSACHAAENRMASRNARPGVSVNLARAPWPLEPSCRDGKLPHGDTADMR